jgi:hypothetical protein
MDLVGRVHRCVPRQAEQWSQAATVVRPKPAAAKGGAYRYREAERRRAYMRELMRKWRAAGKTV